MTNTRFSVFILTFVAATCLCLTGSLQAQLKWVGGTSSDIFEEANWDLNSTSVTSIEPNVSITDDVVIGPGPFTYDPEIPDVADQQRFQLDDGRSLTLQGATLTAAGNDGVGGDPSTVNGPTVHVLDGAQFNPFFVVYDVKVSIDGSSSATFGGGGNPINVSSVDLSPGGVLAFVQEDPSEYIAEHLSKTTVLGAPAVDGVNITIAGDGNTGSIITAIPEPSTLFLAGFAGLLLLTRRR